jgi:hypothetical protein
MWVLSSRDDIVQAETAMVYSKGFNYPRNQLGAFIKPSCRFTTASENYIGQCSQESLRGNY